MAEHVYWPYDEVGLEVDSKAQRVNVMAPWLELSVQMEPEDCSATEQIARKMNEGLGPDDLPLINSFFSHFSQFPLSANPCL